VTLWEYAIKTRCPDGNWALEAERWTNETEFVYAFTKRCKSRPHRLQGDVPAPERRRMAGA
jgi:hypothetical protein